MTLSEILRARKRIAPYVRRTPLLRSDWLSDLAGAPVALKLESLQMSNSFKARGAFNAVMARRERAGSGPMPLVTASAGNHGRALAAAAQAFGVPLVVFTPTDAPRAKLSAILRHGAVLRAEGRDYEHAEQLAKAYAHGAGTEYVSPYSDLDVIAGAATIGVEVFEEAPGTDTLVVPVGGGGLIAGVAEAAKAISPTCHVIGVEAAASCPFQTSLRAGRIVTVDVGPTLADGLSGNPDPQTITFAPIRRLVDRIVTVDEESLACAVVGLVEREHLIAEGAGAAAVAALLGGRLSSGAGAITIVVTGSNIDRGRLTELLSNARGCR